MKCAGCHRDSPDVFIADGTGWMHWQCEIDRLNARIAGFYGVMMDAPEPALCGVCDGRGCPTCREAGA